MKIKKVYQALSDPSHPVSIAMERQKTVKEVRGFGGIRGHTLAIDCGRKISEWVCDRNIIFTGDILGADGWIVGLLDGRVGSLWIERRRDENKWKLKSIS